jgi:MFS family permease
VSWRPALATLCVIGLASFFSEGAVGDWSSVYLRDVTGAPAGLAGAGYVAFTAVMLVTRLVGDRLFERLGAGRAVRALAGGATVLFAAGLAERGTAGGLVAFAAVGAGSALAIPASVSAAGRLGGPGGGNGVNVVVGCGYAGWLVGPPLLGALAELLGLRAALFTVVALLATIVVLAPALDLDRPAYNADRPALEPGRPARGRDRLAGGRDQPARGTDRPAGGQDQPRLGRDQPALDPVPPRPTGSESGRSRSAVPESGPSAPGR